jgi:hypothetical protein
MKKLEIFEIVDSSDFYESRGDFLSYLLNNLKRLCFIGGIIDYFMIT